MKVLVRVLAVVVLSFSVISCLDVTQHVSIDQGKMLTDTRITVQVALLHMVQDYGETDTDWDTMFTADSLQELRQSIPQEIFVSLNAINTDLEEGINLKLRYPANKAPENLDFAANGDASFPLFMPYMRGKTLVVAVRSADSMDSEEDNEMAAAILSGFKYRLFIDKSVMPNPKSAKLVSDTEQIPVTLVLYPGFSMVEVSMAFIMSGTPFQLIVE